MKRHILFSNILAAFAMLTFSVTALAQPDITIEPEELEFEVVRIGDVAEMALIISNDGNENLVVARITVEGEFFAVDNEGDFELEPGELVEVAVLFEPWEEGEFEGAVTIISNDPDEGEFVILLQARAELRIIIFDPDCIEEELFSGDMEELVLVIYSEHFQGDRFTIEIEFQGNDDEQDWLTVDPEEGEFEGDEGVEITITIDARNLNGGLYEAHIHFFGDNREFVATLTIALDVTGIPLIRVEPEVLDFGEVLVGEEEIRTLTIFNNGAELLIIDEIVVEGDYFSVNNDRSIEVEQNENFEIPFIFTPEEEGVFEGMLTIFSNAPQDPEIILELHGRSVAGRELSLPLTDGWNLISINISPPREFYREDEERGPDIIRMLEQLRINEENHHVLLMKNEDGRFYSPAFGFNNIPYWELTEGYQVKVDEDVEAVWIGDWLPPDTDIPIEEGWNLVAYFPTYELDASAPNFHVLSPIIDHVLIAKNGLGNFMVPNFNFSNMPPWRETQGYQVKVDEDVVLNYPGE